MEKDFEIIFIEVFNEIAFSQITVGDDGPLTSDLSQALLLNMSELRRLQRRTKELQEEIKAQKALHRQAHHQHIKLIKDHKDMSAQIQGQPHTWSSV